MHTESIQTWYMYVYSQSDCRPYPGNWGGTPGFANGEFPPARLSLNGGEMQTWMILQWPWGTWSVVVSNANGTAENNRYQNGTPSTAADLGYSKPIRLSR